MTDKSEKARTRFAAVFAAAALAGCSADTADLQPLQWQKIPGNFPGGEVLGFGSPGSFDERGNFTISAFKEDGVFKLYYGGADTFGTCAGPNGSHWRIGLATSTDGVNWTRVAGSATGGAILDIGDPGHFDSFLTYRPFVLHEGPSTACGTTARPPRSIAPTARWPRTGASATPSPPTASTSRA